MFTGLAPGVYTVTVFLAGFGEVRVDDVVVVADPVALPDITLQLAAFDDVVVVTATRIEEPLPQLPLSIAAVTGADIERRAIGNLTALSHWTPGLTVVDQGTARWTCAGTCSGWRMVALPGPRPTLPSTYRSSRASWRCAAPLIATPTPDSSTTTTWCARRASPSRNRI